MKKGTMAKLIQASGDSGFFRCINYTQIDDVYIILLANHFSSWINEARNTLAAIMFDQRYDVPTL